MKRIATFLTLLSLAYFPLSANHIVGGEIIMTHIEGFQYELTLYQYFDAFQTTNPGPDGLVSISIYSNRSNDLMETIDILLTERVSLSFSDPKCARQELQADRVRYSTEITLSPEIYNESEGYYAVWLRCCRGLSIVNIVNPSQAGMTYILEFPAVVDNDNEPFVNSSPFLPVAFNDNACIDQIYYLDLGAEDPDGDSLHHSLITPLTTVSDPIPPLQSKPYDNVIFEDGYSEEEMIIGDPSLAITGEGFLTVNPSSKNTGIHTFAILVEEYRNGEKIGEIRRDFRIPIYNDCEPPIPPMVSALDLSGLPIQDGDTIEYIGKESKCFNIVVEDLPGETFEYTTQLVENSTELNGLFQIETGTVPDTGEPLEVEVCISDCPAVQEGYFSIDFIISDDTCPLPQRDTLRLTYNIKAPKNTRPTFDVSNDERRSISIDQGKEINIESLTGLDADQDSLEFYFYSADFDPLSIGISMDTTDGVAGQREASIHWNTDCRIYDFGDRQIYELGLVIEDKDTCNFDSGDTLFYDLEVILPPNTAPSLELTDFEGNEEIELNIKDQLTIDMNALDPDKDSIMLSGYGFGFNFASVGIDFTDQLSNDDIATSLFWDLSCENLGITETTTYTLKFNLEDQDVCKEINTEERTLKVTVNVPENNPPMFELDDNSGVKSFELETNKRYELDITATDLDTNDLLTIDLLSAFFRPDSDSLKIERASGTGGQVNTTLEWYTDCSLLGPDFTSKKYSTFLLVWDDNCPNIQKDTLAVNFEVSDLQVDHSIFSPPNAFSPNGDQINDYFVLSDLNLDESNLPLDNCRDQFQSIKIFDRKGRKVFSSTNRQFRWSGTDEEPGTYFYHIKYLDLDYKGMINLIR